MNHDFCNLHCHSQFSWLDGYGSPDRMVRRVKEMGQKALSLTEHGNMSSILSFKQSCEAHDIKFIPGQEFYIAPWGRDVHWRRDDNKRAGTAYHLTAWSYNQIGYQNLLKLTELANRVGFYYNPRIDYSMLENFNEGLIITSGCMASELARLMNPANHVTTSSYRKANEILSWAYEVFGLDRYYIEIQDHGIDELKHINLELSRINKRYQFSYLATNDSHYPTKDDSQGQVASLCIGQKTTLDNPGDFILGTYATNTTYYLASYHEMLDKEYGFPFDVSALTNTVKISNMVEDIKIGYEPEVKKYRFPVMPEYENNYDNALAKMAWAGLEKRYPTNFHGRNMEAVARLSYELSVIKRLGFSSYFLCVYDIKRYCDDNKIPVTVRGSAGGSIVLYCLWVTDFCPLHHNLIFERFLNPDRVSAPDADLDIGPDYRANVIKYIMGKYGDDHVAQVVNFVYIKGRSAIRDATRILSLPYEIGDVLVNRMVEGPKVSVSETNSEKSPNYVPHFIQSPTEQKIFDLAVRLEGQVRTTGIHAGAVMLSDRPLYLDYPMMKPKSSSKATTGLLVAIDYESAEKIGGIKLDILGVEALGILHRAIRIINARHGTDYRFENIPVDDESAYELINSGHLSEIFQLSGHTARSVSAVIKPRNIDDIMVVSSLARPGPLQYVDLYAKRMHGVSSVQYLHPDLEPILSDTCGIIIYQEQAMRISQVIAGFSGSEADILRKAISKKKGMDKVLEKFEKSALAKGYEREFIEKLCLDLIEFGEYCFNASHACSYSRIGVKQAYLKANFTIEYYSAALTGRIGNDRKMYELMTEMHHFGIKLLPPRLGKSAASEFMIDDENNGIRFPYLGIKNVGKAAYKFQKLSINSLSDIGPDELRTLRKIGKRPIEALALVGGFDGIFNGDRNKAMKAIRYLWRGLLPMDQLSYTDTGQDEDVYSKSEFYAYERELTGLYISDHPLDEYSGILAHQKPFADTEYYESRHGELGAFFGIVTSIRLHRDRKGNIMSFVEIEDKDYNTMPFVVFSDLYSQVKDELSEGCVVRVLGEINVRYGKNEEEEAKLIKYGRVSIIASKIRGSC